MEWSGTVCRECWWSGWGLCVGVLVEWSGTVCWQSWWSGWGLCVGSVGGVVGDTASVRKVNLRVGEVVGCIHSHLTL